MSASPAPNRSRNRRATLALFAIALIWGITFLWMKQAMTASTRVLGEDGAVAGCTLFLLLRFGIGAFLLWICFPSARRVATPAVWSGGAWLGGLLIVGFVLQMLGLQDVTPAVSAFLTSLYVLFLALITPVLVRRRPRIGLAVGALLATAGAGLVRGRPEIAHWSTGEVMTVVAAFAFAVHILATDRITRRVEPMPVTWTMFVVVAGCAGLILCADLLRAGAPSAAQLVELASQRDFLVPLALNATLATVVALSLMNLYQREVDPVRAAILYAFEPIWASLAGIVAGEDAFTGWLVVGGSLLLAGNLVAELAGTRHAPAAAESGTD